MDSARQNSDFSSKYLLGQLNIARKEINNLRYYLHSFFLLHPVFINAKNYSKRYQQVPQHAVFCIVVYL